MENWLKDFLRNYKECFEKLNEVALSMAQRVELTKEEIELLKEVECKYKNMAYHIRKAYPGFKIPKNKTAK